MFKRVIVTGGAGFIGSNLVLAIQKKLPNAEITVIDDFRSAEFRHLEGYTGDVIAAELAEADLAYYFGKTKIDVVFHLASNTDTTDHDQFGQVFDNVEGWRNLLRFFAGRKTRFVYASSAATYGISTGVNHPSQTPRPANVYAFSKVQLDNLAKRWAAENPKQRIVGLKYFNVYGPREAHKQKAASMIYQLAQQMADGKRPRIFASGEQKRDFVYVKDIVSFTMAAALAVRNGLYNAGSGQARSFNDIIANLNRVLGTGLEPEYFPCPFSFYQPHTEADMEDTAKALRASPKFSLEAGIDDYRASGFLVPSFGTDAKPTEKKKKKKTA
jgi:ADP-L-glycero-D-manno-heptose 6-epimerase